ncbi:hypothetical protein [Streptomyces sp. 1222.5]|uniref:hypothetical protein n=1 Tax=Streptomyces sp. 1222.5 TaxID=1881026 RepID=UPI003EB9DB3D
MSDYNTEHSTTTEQPQEKADASSRSERPDLTSSVSDAAPDKGDNTASTSDPVGGAHQGERPEISSAKPDGPESREHLGNSDESKPGNGDGGPDQAGEEAHSEPSASNIDPGFEMPTPEGFKGDPGFEMPTPEAFKGDPGFEMSPGHSSSEPQHTQGVENSAESATDPTLEASSGEGADQGEHPELGTSAETDLSGAPEANPAQDTELAQEPTTKLEDGSKGSAAEPEGGREDLRSDDGQKAKGGGEKTTTPEGGKTWTTPDGHRHTETPTPDGKSFHTESWKTPDGHSHIEITATDGSKTHTESWTDKGGDHSHTVRTDKNGDVVSTSDHRDWKSPDGHRHTEVTNVGADGTISGWTSETWRDKKDGKEHFSGSETDANGTTYSSGTRWTDKNGAKHENSVTTGPITVSPGKAK